MEQAVAINAPATGTDRLVSELLRLRDHEGVTFASISAKTGVNRTAISQFVNQGLKLRPEQEQKLWDAVKDADAVETLDTATICTPPKYKSSIDIYQTAEFTEAMGWLSYVMDKRKMGVLIGHPGSGKSTILRYFAQRQSGVLYIEAWPTMRMGDLLYAIGRAVGASLEGNNHQKAQRLMAALKDRTDVMIVVDEAEYLGKWDVDKFEILRKLWDNTGTPIVLCGTQQLEDTLIHGTGKKNLAQLYRRKVELKLKGISSNEARTILRDYNVDKAAADALAAIAADVRHGGMGTFVEILDLCLEAAEGGQITTEVLASAKKYKLMF